MKARDVLALSLLLGLAVSSAGGKKGYVAPGYHDVYRALRRKGFSKSHAAATANSMAGKKKRGGAKSPGRKKGKR